MPLALVALGLLGLGGAVYALTRKPSGSAAPGPTLITSTGPAAPPPAPVPTGAMTTTLQMGHWYRLFGNSITSQDPTTLAQTLTNMGSGNVKTVLQDGTKGPGNWTFIAEWSGKGTWPATLNGLSITGAQEVVVPPLTPKENQSAQVVQALKQLDPNMPDLTAKAVYVALDREYVPSELLNFSRSLAPDLPVSSTLLKKKADSITDATLQAQATGTQTPAQVSGFVVGNVFDDIGDALSGVAHGISTVVDTIRNLPGVSWVADRVQDFGNTTVGKAFFMAIAPTMLFNIFTTLPGFGLQIAQVLSSMGPLATYALPGLVKGERADRAFIDSAKDIASRLGPQASSQLPAAISTAADALQKAGIDTKTLSDQADKLRASLQGPFGKVANQKVQDQIDQKVEEFTQQWADKLNSQLLELADKAGVPEQVMQAALDGVTRTMGYKNKSWTSDGRLRTPARIAQEQADARAKAIRDATLTKERSIRWNDAEIQLAIDSFANTPDGAKEVYVTQGKNSGWQYQGGRFMTSAQIFALTRQPHVGGSWGGKLGNVPLDYIRQRVQWWHDNPNPGLQPGQVPKIPVARPADTTVVLPVLPPDPPTAAYPLPGSRALIDTVGNVVIRKSSAGVSFVGGTRARGKKPWRYAGTMVGATAPASPLGWYGVPTTTVVTTQPAPGKLIGPSGPITIVNMNTPWDSPNWAGDPLILYKTPPDPLSSNGYTLPVIGLIPNRAIVTLLGTPDKNGFVKIGYGTAGQIGQFQGYVDSKLLKEDVTAAATMPFQPLVPIAFPLTPDLIAMRAYYVKKYTGYDASASQAG